MTDLSEKAQVIVTTTGWFVVVLLFILATVATVGVFKYSRGVELPVDDDPMVAVVVSQVDVPAGTDLNQLIKNDQPRLIEITLDAVVDGAVTSVDRLKDKHSARRILAGEQIVVERLRPSGRS